MELVFSSLDQQISFQNRKYTSNKSVVSNHHLFMFSKQAIMAHHYFIWGAGVGTGTSIHSCIP